MKNNKKLGSFLKGVYFITEKSLYPSKVDELTIIKKAMEGKVCAIQLREKNETKKEIYKRALAIKNYISPKKIHPPLIINDHLDIALDLDSDGVHLGQKDLPLTEARKLLGPEKIIGISVKNLTEAKVAQEQGADYLGVGPIFSTQTKKDADPPIGLSLFAKIKKNISLPLVAIGGINQSNITSLAQKGCRSAAIISALFINETFIDNIKEFNQILLGN